MGATAIPSPSHAGSLRLLLLTVGPGLQLPNPIGPNEIGRELSSATATPHLTHHGVPRVDGRLAVVDKTARRCRLSSP